MTSLLRIDGLSVGLGGRTVVRDLSWTVEPGEFVGLLGPNGAGKTTLLRSVLGLIPAAAGSVRIDGRPPRAARLAVGYVPQKHHFAWEFPITVEDAVLSGRTGVIGWFRQPRAADWRLVHRALERVDLTALRHRPVGELSGGQRQRVLLARVLANDPRLLLLDESFTGVDAPTQDLLTELYTSLAEEGMGIVMTTHDVPAALESCGRICGLRGNIALDADPGVLDAQTVHAWLRGREVGVPTARTEVSA